MEQQNDLSVLRARDFWAALFLILVSAFFLWRTSFIPLFGGNRAVVSGANWYNSAAVVPLGIFGAMFALSLILLWIAVRDGGAKTSLSSVGIGWDRFEAIRFTALIVIMGSYIAGLVPRVDFILCSGLLITALIYGFHGGQMVRMLTAACALVLPAAYAMIRHLPQSEWAKPHDDDWITLLIWVLLSMIAWHGSRNRVGRITPAIAVIAPLVLVCVMAFGFRQNVPNRAGLIFSQIEYQYYVNIRPIWRK